MDHQKDEDWDYGDAVFHLANTNHLPDKWEIAVSYVTGVSDGQPVLADGYWCYKEENAIHYPYMFRTFEEAETRIDEERKAFAKYQKSRDGRIERMALKHFDDIETLCFRYFGGEYGDDTDIRQVSVCDIFDALIGAYEMGLRDASKKPSTRRNGAQKTEATKRKVEDETPSEQLVDCKESLV